MALRKNKLILFMVIWAIIFFSSIALSQFEPETKRLPQGQEQIPPLENSFFEEIPVSYWVRINALGTVSLIIVLLAFLIGLVSCFIGWNAGGRINSRLIKKSIFFTTLVAFFARPLFNLGQRVLGQVFDSILPTSYAYGISGLFIFIIWVLYISAMPLLLYESFTVTAKEAYPPRS